MKKLCSLLFSILILIGVSVRNSTPVLADTVYTCSSRTVTAFNQDLSADFSQSLTVKNLSTQYVIHFFDLFLPFTATNITATINGGSVIVQNDQGHVQLDLEEHFIGPQAQVDIELSFKAPGLVKQNGSFRSLYLPKMDYCNNADSTVSFKYPNNWGDPSYISSDKAQKQDGSFYMPGTTDLYLVFGKPGIADISANWQLRSGKTVPIPGSSFNNFQVTSVPDAAKVFKDVYGNEYLQIANATSNNFTFSGKLTPIENSKLPDNGVTYTDDPSTLNIDTSQSVAQIYQAVLDKYEPVLVRSFSSSKTLADIAGKQKQDAFDYAYTLATLLQTKGLKAEVFYGLVRLPVNEEYIWHFWVGYEDQGQLQWADPFFADLFKFNSLGSITPDRMIWGVYGKDNDFVLDSLWNFTDPNGIISYTNSAQDPQQVLGDQFGATAELVVKNDLARQLGVTLTNTGSNVIYIDQLLLNKGLDVSGSFQNLGILPKQSTYLDLSSFISPGFVINNSGQLQANLKVSSNGREYELATNSMTLQSFWVYIIFSVVIFMMFVVMVHIVRVNLPKLNFKFNRDKN